MCHNSTKNSRVVTFFEQRMEGDSRSRSCRRGSSVVAALAEPGRKSANVGGRPTRQHRAQLYFRGQRRTPANATKAFPKPQVAGSIPAGGAQTLVDGGAGGAQLWGRPWSCPSFGWTSYGQRVVERPGAANWAMLSEVGSGATTLIEMATHGFVDGCATTCCTTPPAEPRGAATKRASIGGPQLGDGTWYGDGELVEQRRAG